MTKVKRESDKSHVEWTTKKFLEEVKDGRINFEIDIQRGYVWKDNDQKSALIQSLILDDFVPPLYLTRFMHLRGSGIPLSINGFKPRGGAPPG